MIEREGAHAPDLQKTRHARLGRCKDCVCYQNDNECNPMKIKDERFFDNKCQQNDFICYPNDFKRNHNIEKSGDDVSSLVSSKFCA